MRSSPVITDVRGDDPSEELLRPAVEALQRGAVVAFPTDTVYGLGALADNTAAVDRLYAMKGRAETKPLQVLLADTARGEALGILPPAARLLAEAFWPGGLTIVVPRPPDLWAPPARGRPTIGLRVPACAAARALIRLAGPLAATSANRSGQPSPRTAADVLAGLSAELDCLLDGGEAPLGRESTVVDVSGPQPVVLRAGAVSIEALARVLPGLRVAGGAD